MKPWMRRLSLWPALMLATPRFRDVMPWVIPEHLQREQTPRAPSPIHRSLCSALPYFTGTWEREWVMRCALILDIQRHTEAATRHYRSMDIRARDAWPASASIADYWRTPMARATDRDAVVPPLGASTADRPQEVLMRG
jgi:hypothetical protein